MDYDEADERDELAMIKGHLRSGLAMRRVGRARLRLALPAYREKLLSIHSVAFVSLCEFYAASVLMVDDLRKEVPVRAELLAEYETMCRNMEADAVAMMKGERNARWR
ncbi:hypothetical protein AC244_16155 [Ensifer adhaerens]|uniref:Uncharacterized protein n=1 Tax=Ensifer adhaerens TaxID=106592 RepID=A0A0L8BTI7_ENSAD|nr:hypothetical protein [Ensifer adhaerens]KOF17893.1 hypothetical protein AC244_16155 [Ensifer adhaerens]